MSFLATQRVMVRMLYDPAFTAAVFESPQRALRDCALSAEEVRWIAATDRRAWQLDPLRRSRTLQALIEEFPASAATTLSLDGQARRLDAFFSSSHFHDAIQTRQALVGAFGAFLGAAGVPALTPMVHIEAAIARCRRCDGDAARPAGHITLAPGREVLQLPGGALTRFGAIVEQLDSAEYAPVEAMLADGFRLRDLPDLDDASREHVLVEPGPDGPGLGEISDPLAQLLLAASSPVERGALLEIAVGLGAEADEAGGLLDGLIAEGVLTAGSYG